MQNLRPRSPYLILCVVVIATTLTFFITPYLWNLLLGPLHPHGLNYYPFGDMGGRLSSAEGLAHGIDINNEPNPYSDYEGLNNKPLYTVRILAALSFDRSDKITLGIFFGALFTAWNLWLVRPTRWHETLIAAMVFLSPPVLLLIERANDDIIIYCFAFALPLLLHQSNILFHFFGWLIISALTPMKYYPAALYSLFLYKFKNTRSLLYWVGVSGTFLLLLFKLTADEMSTIAARIPSPDSNFAFGSKLIFQSLKWSESAQAYGFYLCIGALASLVLILMLQKRWNLPKFTPRSQRYFLFGSSALTFCFLLNGNWDYRLAFLIPTLPLAFELLRHHAAPSRLLGMNHVILIILTLWVEYVYFCMNFNIVTGQWVFLKTTYKKVLIFKHLLSWGAIISCITISCLILKDDFNRFLKDLISQLKKPCNEDSPTAQ